MNKVGCCAWCALACGAYPFIRMSVMKTRRHGRRNAKDTHRAGIFLLNLESCVESAITHSRALGIRGQGWAADSTRDSSTPLNRKAMSTVRQSRDKTKTRLLPRSTSDITNLGPCYCLYPSASPLRYYSLLITTVTTRTSAWRQRHIFLEPPRSTSVISEPAIDVVKSEVSRCDPEYAGCDDGCR